MERSNVRLYFGDSINPIPQEVLPQWERQNILWEQVHEVDSVEIISQNQNCGKADTLYTQTPEIVIGVKTADCTPILLAEKSGNMVAAIHAGWRGTEKKIVETFCKKIKKEFNQNLNSWSAWIGPTIGPCCYEVGTSLVEKFSKTFPDFEFSSNDHLDLAQINCHELNKAGIYDVKVSTDCTHCTKKDKEYKYFSYRRDQTDQRQFSVVGITRD